MYFINCFFFFAILGFLFESIFFILIKKPYNSSILYGPWTPVYVIAFFIIYFLGIFIKRFHLKKIYEIIIYFFLVALSLALLEFISGELILLFGHVRYWNYENLTFDIDGFICLEVTLFWGIAGTFINYFLYPRAKKFLKKIPKVITIIFILLYVIDSIFTFLK